MGVFSTCLEKLLNSKSLFNAMIQDDDIIRRIRSCDDNGLLHLNLIQFICVFTAS